MESYSFKNVFRNEKFCFIISALIFLGITKGIFIILHFMFF